MKKHLKNNINKPEFILILIALSILIGCCFSNSALAQYANYNHPELRWQTIENERCIVHFHQGTERTARIVLAIAEKIYDPLTELYDYRPDGKLHYIIRDHDDYSNGGAYYYDNKIEIWAKPLDFELRGSHNWLWDVVTHETTHMIQLGASRKGPRWMPGIYFQLIDYEPEKCPDVLYGFPNRIASWPIALTSVPMWFAEGTAQFMTRDLKHDWWDSHRDMNIRVRVLDDNLLTYNQMCVFGKTSLDAESVYNHGYSLTRFIADEWGEDVLQGLSGVLGDPFTLSFNSASKKILGISEKELYRRWKDSLTTHYQEKTATIRSNIINGELLHDEGFANIYPEFSPDGKRIAFLSNKGQDYLSLSRLLYYDFEKKEIIESEAAVKGDFSWSPDSRYIAYARKTKPDIHGSKYSDIYLWDTQNEKAIRLTRNARLAVPSYAPDGKSLVAVHNTDGSENLAIVQLPDSIFDSDDLSDSIKWENLTHFTDGRQIFRPQYSTNGSKIFAATLDLNSRDIYSYDLTNEYWVEAWKPLVTGDADDRDVTVSADGNFIIFASDRTGIFNLYSMDLYTGKITALTNVIGGAFMPDVASDNQIVFAEFADGGYQLRKIDKPSVVEPDLLQYLTPEEQERPNLSAQPVATGKAQTYATPFNKLFFLPRIAWDHGKFKPGFYAYTGDLLDKLTLFAGAAVGEKGERDIYLNGEYSVLYPTLYIEAFNIVRHQSQTFEDPFVITGERIENGVAVPIYGDYSIDYKFDLLEVDLGAKVPVFEDYVLSAIFRNSKYRAILEFDDGGNFDYTYHRGNSYILRLNSDQRGLNVGQDIHPKSGFRGFVESAYENNRFLDGFEIEAEKGTIQEVYTDNNYLRVEADVDYYWNFYESLVLNPRLMAGWLSDDSVDSFYNLYAGGLMGLRGYPFYSMGGTKRGAGRLTMRFPILTGIDKKLGPFYFDRIHGGIFAEAGDAWVSKFDVGNIKSDVGAELRMKLFSWYGFPTDLQFTGAYGLNRFQIRDDNGFPVEYGKNWMWYFTLLFDFI